MREYKEVSIDLIDESDNIRRSFSEEKLQELASSIRQRGVLKPVLVRPNGDRFKLIDGWRRLSAAKLAECRTIPVRVRDIDENAAEDEMNALSAELRTLRVMNTQTKRCAFSCESLHVRQRESCSSDHA